MKGRRNSNAAGGTTASTSSQPPSTSLGQCTTSATRLIPTITAQPPARPATTTRIERRRTSDQQTRTTISAVAADAVVWPDGKDQPAAGANWSTGRARWMALTSSNRIARVTGSVTATKQAARSRRRHSSTRQPAAAIGPRTAVLPVMVTAAIVERHHG